MSGAILVVDNVTKVYKRSHLGRSTTARGIENVSFQIKDGEVFGLLGLNGSGKTTTIKLILGLLRPSEGRVSVFGRPVPDTGAQKKIGYLPEVPYFYRNLTPVEVLKLYASVSKVDPQTISSRIDEVLALVKMDHVRKKPMREFSKGMLQRIGLAQTIIHNPDLLILDEPVTGLDPLGIRQTRQLILDLNKNGKTILFSSHSISELERLANRVGILIEGKMVRFLDQSAWKDKQGRLEEIFIETLENPAGPWENAA